MTNIQIVPDLGAPGNGIGMSGMHPMMDQQPYTQGIGATHEQSLCRNLDLPQLPE